MRLLWEVHESIKHQIRCSLSIKYSRKAWMKEISTNVCVGWIGVGIHRLPSWTLCLILCLLFRSDSLLSSSTQGPLIEGWEGSLPDHLPTELASPCSGEEEELYYANLSFSGMKPRDPQEQEAAGSEYSEIKIHKWATAETRPWLEGSRPLWGKEQVRSWFL